MPLTADQRRIHPRVVVRHSSPNKSFRSSRIKLIVVHATVSHNYPRSIRDLREIGDLFASRSFEASSHVCTDGDGHSARFVDDHYKAWHCAGYNSYALGVEQVHYGTEHWSRDEYRETARWIARWSILHGVPIRQGRTLGGRVLRSGVVTHRSLGRIGGGHIDPQAQSLKDLLELARHYKHELRVAGGHSH